MYTIFAIRKQSSEDFFLPNEKNDGKKRERISKQLRENFTAANESFHVCVLVSFLLVCIREFSSVKFDI